MTKNIEPIYIDHKARGNQLTAEEFNKIPEKVNELVKAQNTEEERIKQVVAKNRPTLGQLQNVSDEVDSLTSETCVLVWNGDAWVSMKLACRLRSRECSGRRLVISTEVIQNRLLLPTA